ncbi:glycerophosphodiester phosphodiesterase [Streptomyces fulvissimus]|uniref:Glycerophosphodiester phosphodiesterase n=1 Tax=Streptomyces microflavus TaxID=1919 RepID=A0A6N9VC63_STRMI|nr:glycerophosphodiester phosphodiesterase [Streptomyces microflavus]NEB70336.1 glycerophosphodiester phosphodiesterase [Streptomyces microflavus]
MPFPEGLPTTLVSYAAANPAGGGPAQGTVTFELTVDAISLTDTGIVYTGSGTYAFNDDGQLVDDTGTPGVRLIPNDLPYANPQNSRWLVTDRIAGAPVRSYYISLSVDQPEADLGKIQQMDAGQPEYTAVIGPKGLSAYEQWLADDNEGTEEDFLASLIGPPGSEANAQAYTDDALTSEITRANAAYDPAGAATAARIAAINTAADDATSKANNAQSAATSAASSDASTKASAAQANAINAAATSAATLYLPSAIQTVDAYLAGATPSSPRFFGHRGGGMVRPEHTLVGYRACAAMGFALEVSVNVDASGELWCLHDTTLDRTTYQTGNLNTYTTEEVGQAVLTNGRTLLGPGWTDQRMVSLRQVLDEFLGKIPILLEPKGNDAVVPTQSLLDTYYPHAPRSVIWKAHIGTLSLPWAKTRGYRTWVYLDSNTTDATMDGKDANVDYWGVSTTFTDQRIQQVVARGKPVFAWPVYRRSQVARLTGLGVVGMMSSDPRYVSTSTPQRTFSRWGLAVKESGGTPTLDYDTTYALVFGEGADAGWVSINALPNQSYGLGTYSPIVGSAAGYRIAFDMKYKVLPASTVHGGYYFGKASDDPYRFGTANTTGGYHVVMRASGDMQLYRHTAGVTTGTQIGSTIATTPPVADTAMSFQINVTPTTVELRRTDSTGWTTGAIADTTYRGGYHGLSNGSITDLNTRPYWRNLVITQL